MEEQAHRAAPPPPTRRGGMSPLLIIEIILLSGFWVALYLGGIFHEEIVPGLDTILFFEPVTVVFMCMITLATGILIGGIIERYSIIQKHQKEPFNPPA